MDVEREVRRLIDERDVADVMRRYAHGLDRADWAQVEACFHPVGRIEGLGYSGTTDHYLPRFLARMKRSAETTRSQHFLGNLRVVVDGDHATLDAYAIAVSVTDPAGTYALTASGLRYFDELVRVAEGEWQITSRRVVGDWTFSTSGPPASEFFRQVTAAAGS